MWELKEVMALHINTITNLKKEGAIGMVKIETINVNSGKRRWEFESLDSILKDWWLNDGWHLPSADDEVTECILNGKKMEVKSFDELITELLILYWNQETNKEESETAKELIIAIEDGIVMEVYTDIKTPIDIKVIDSDDLYDEERQDKYIQTQKTINENIENGKFINIFMD